MYRGFFLPSYVGVSKNRGAPKWMVKIMENPIKMDDLGGKPHYFRKHPCGDYFFFHSRMSTVFFVLDSLKHQAL